MPEISKENLEQSKITPVFFTEEDTVNGKKGYRVLLLSYRQRRTASD